MEPDRSDPRRAAPDFEQRRVEALLISRMFGGDEQGSKIGRFTVLDRVGRGGMGDVYAAYDPQLDRKVALKLLHRVDTDERVLREARTMASINHPNVAQIYEVGVSNERVFIAMEFVKGQTLRVWLGAAERTWREMLATFRQAGCGLVAAHEAGVVHRDFKPENVLVGDDGRVRVVDFGLARESIGEPTDEPDAAVDHHLPAGTTPTGAVAGTPAYMAPEQFRGRGADARSDQFAFCVALHEALHGERPYLGDTTDSLFAAVERGEVHVSRSAPTLPDWVVRPVRRGLMPDSESRHPSMDALLDELEKDPSIRRRRLTVVGAGLLSVALVLAGVEGLRRYDSAMRTAACDAAGTSIHDVWNDEARARVRERLVATGVSYAPTTAEKVMPWLDDQAEAWREHRTEACMNADVRGTWDADMLDRALWCLDERQLELTSLVTELERADADVVQRAVIAASSLDKVSLCVDGAVLARLTMPPAGNARAASAEFRAEFARVRTLKDAGKYGEALGLARSSEDRAEAIGWPPLSAARKELLGELLFRTGSYAESEDVLVAAYVEAATASAWDVAASTSAQLIYIVGVLQGRHVEGRTWATHSAVAASQAGDPLGLRESARVSSLGNVELQAGAYEEARALHMRALVIDQRVLGPNHPYVGGDLSNLGNVEKAAGAYDEAKALHERSLAISENALGPNHPDVARSLHNLALAHEATGDYSEARALLERALAIDLQAVGADHPSVSRVLNALAMVHSAMGEYERAKAMYERALAIKEKNVGPDHPEVATTLHNLAILHHEEGAHSEAKLLAERALAIETKSLGPGHPEIASSLSNLASIHMSMGAHAEARDMYERALRIREAAFGSDHSKLVGVLVGLATVAVEQSRPEDALPHVERAVRLIEEDDTPAVDIALAHFILARALWDAPISRGRDRDRALKAAVAARDASRASEGQVEAITAEIEAWLAAHSN